MVRYSANDQTYDNGNPSGAAFSPHITDAQMRGQDRDDRVSLHPLSADEALRALLRTPLPARGTDEG